MKKYYNLTLGAFTVLFLSACTTEPALDMNKTHIEVVKGKSYQIPDGAKVSPYVDEKVITFYQSLGLTSCKEGDITWEAESAKDEISTAISKGKRSVYQKLAKEGKVGCASALK